MTKADPNRSFKSMLAMDDIQERVSKAKFEKLIKQYLDMGYSRAEAIKRVHMDGTYEEL